MSEKRYRHRLIPSVDDALYTELNGSWQHAGCNTVCSKVPSMYLVAVAISLKTIKTSVASRSVVESCFNACFAKWLAV